MTADNHSLLAKKIAETYCDKILKGIPRKKIASDMIKSYKISRSTFFRLLALGRKILNCYKG